MTLFSRRFQSLVPAGTVAFLKAAEQRRQQGGDILSLAAAEPYTRTSAAVNQAAIDVIERQATRYAGAEGIPALKQALQAKFLRENRLHVDEANILVANGSKPLMAATLLALLNPGDEVVLPTPYYNAHGELIKLAEGVPVLLPTRQSQRFIVQPEALDAVLSARTKAVFFSSPNNPSGATYQAEDWHRLAPVLQAWPQVWIVVDEIFENWVYPGVAQASPGAAVPAWQERTIVINGFSKGYSMNGWRLGFAAAPSSVVVGISAVATHISGPPSPITQAGGVAALTQGGQPTPLERQQMLALRDETVAALNAIPGLQCHTPEATFLAFPRCADVLGKTSPSGHALHTDQDYAQALLAETGVAVVPGSDFGYPGHFRLSFGPGEAIVRQALERIARFHRQLQ